MRRLLILLLPAMLLTAACGSNTPNPDLIRIAVQATLRAVPASTRVAPTPVPPSATPVSLIGIFCEYQFCIGHPTDMAFYDVSAAQNQASPSNFSQGILAAYSSSLFIQVEWQEAPGTTDPQFMLDLITQGGDTRNGSIEPKLSGDLNVYYAAITPTTSAATTLPYGGAAAWICGQRAFAWKTYTARAELAPTLLADALARFRCDTK